MCFGWSCIGFEGVCVLIVIVWFVGLFLLCVRVREGVCGWVFCYFFFVLLESFVGEFK